MKVNNITERTNLAGNNKMELLIFDIYDEKRKIFQKYGLNVFKVREVMVAPTVTRIPNSQKGVVGMCSLRGQVISIMDLPTCLNINQEETTREYLIVTEFNNNTQGFLVNKIDRIIRLDWSEIKETPAMLDSGLITAITEFENKLISILDVESIMNRLNPTMYDNKFKELEKLPVSDKKHFIHFAEDSKIASKLIESTLEKLGIQYKHSVNGKVAYEELIKMAETYGSKLTEHLSMIITDIEMPQMDGYTLTKLIKEDKRFNGIPVLIQSSLTGNSNKQMGEKVKADCFIDKFNPIQLAEDIKRFI